MKDKVDAEAEQDTYLGARRRDEDKWHVGREIPLALIVVLVVQTGGGVWWASNLNTKMDNVSTTLIEFKVERYTREDGRRDREFLGATLDAIRNRDNDIERRMTAIERSHEMYVLDNKVYRGGGVK